MKYLFSFNENVAQSKVLLKSLNIKENDDDYLKIRDMIKGSDGYAYWFTKLRYKDNQPLEELKNIWSTIKNNDGVVTYFTKPIVELESVEDFWDEFNRAKIKSDAKKVINQFPSNQKRFFDLNNKADLDLLTQLSQNKSLPALIRKISSFRDKASLVDAANRLLKSGLSGKFDQLLSSIKSTGAFVKVADEVNDIIICQVNYPQITKLGGDTSWCIVPSEHTFNNYSSGGIQWIIFLVDNFGSNDRMSKIGLTTHFDYTTAHDKYDGHITKPKLTSILSERGVDIKSLYLSKETLESLPNWNDIPVHYLLNYKFTKEEILEKKFILKKAHEYRRVSNIKNDLDYFTKEEIREFKLLQRTIVSLSDLKRLDKEEILSGNYIQRLNNKPSLNEVFNLGITKDDVIEHELYKYTSIHSQSLPFFSKEELINNEIINLAINVNISDLFSLGFTKEEIIKYSSCLSSSNREMIQFFGNSTPAKARDKISEFIYSQSFRNIPESFKPQLLLEVLAFYGIDSTKMPLESSGRRTSLVNIFRSINLDISKPNLNSLYKLGYKITSDNANSFLFIFGIDIKEYYSGGYNRTPSLSTISKLNRIMNIISEIDNKDSSDIIDNIINKIINNILSIKKQFGREYLESNITFNYKSFFEYKSYLETTKYWKTLLPKLKLVALENPGIITTRRDDDDDRYDAKVSAEKTIKFANELGITKDDFKDKSIYDITDSIFTKRCDSHEKVVEYFKKLGYEIGESELKEILQATTRNAIVSRLDPKDRSIEDRYSEEFAIKLLQNKIEVDKVLPIIISYVRSNNELRTYQVEKYKDIFKDQGKEWNDKLDDAINYVNNKDRHYKILKDLREIFRTSYVSKKLIEIWYKDNYDEYINGLLVNDYERLNNDIYVLLILVMLDKFDDLDKMNFDFSKRGLSFDNNLLHSFSKIVCGTGPDELKKFYTNELLNDEKLKRLYNWLITKVDESQNWVKRNLIVCYYLYDKAKYDSFVNEAMKMKNNYKYYKYNRKGDELEAVKTLRIAEIRPILLYFKDNALFDDFKKLVERLFETKKEGTPRNIKMSVVEFKESIDILSNMSLRWSNNNENYNKFNNLKKELIKDIKQKYTSVKESRLLNWSQFMNL